MRRFGCLHARLYPLMGKKVQTPEGEGTLVQVFGERAAVNLDCDGSRLAVFLPCELGPSTRS